MGASNSSVNNRRNTCNSMGASNTMDISNSRVTINSKDTMATAGRPKMELLKSTYFNFVYSQHIAEVAQ
jgi:hypothetical protein